MRTHVLWIACGLCLLLGVGLGFLAARARGQVRDDRDGVVRAPSERRGDEAGPQAIRERRASSKDSTSRTTPRQTRLHRGDPDSAEPLDDDGIDPDRETATQTEPSRAEEPEDEIERLRTEVAALREEQRELMGEPVSAPAEREPRFEGSAMTGSIQAAMSEASITGNVEGTDCSEHPCIVFGRLEGDEEDMEEIERAAVLSQYEDDVLTLLFWATSVDSGEKSKAPESGLFALAFYGAEERAQRGEELDRRIRARVMEYWNTDRPGSPAEPPGL